MRRGDLDDADFVTRGEKLASFLLRVVWVFRGAGAVGLRFVGRRAGLYVVGGTALFVGVAFAGGAVSLAGTTG